jgi:hypothetical protein
VRRVVLCRSGAPSREPLALLRRTDGAQPDLVADSVPARLKQHRRFDHHEAVPSTRRLHHATRCQPQHARPHERTQPRELRRVCPHAPAKLRAIDATVGGGDGRAKRRYDGRDGGTTRHVQLMRELVRIDDRDAAGS